MLYKEKKEWTFSYTGIKIGRSTRGSNRKVIKESVYSDIKTNDTLIICPNNIFGVSVKFATKRALLKTP